MHLCLFYQSSEERGVHCQSNTEHPFDPEYRNAFWTHWTQRLFSRHGRNHSRTLGLPDQKPACPDSSHNVVCCYVNLWQTPAQHLVPNSKISQRICCPPICHDLLDMSRRLGRRTQRLPENLIKTEVANKLAYPFIRFLY